MLQISSAAALAATQTSAQPSQKKGLMSYPHYFARVDFKQAGQKIDLNSFARQLQRKSNGERLFDEFKAHKADFLILPNNEQRKKANALQATHERNIDSTTLDFMPAILVGHLPKCLIILDYDNAQKYETAKAKFKDFARAEKSQKGGHLWLDISELLSDPSAYLELRNALPYKLKNAQGEEYGESFWGELDANKLIFYTPRLKTQTRAYYSLEFDNLQPAPLDLLQELQETRGDFTAPKTPQKSTNAPQPKAKPKKELKPAKTPQNAPDEQKDANGYFKHFSREWRKKNTALIPLIARLDESGSATDADIFELKAIYNDSVRAFQLENIAEGNRNATISALAAFLAHYGFFASFVSFDRILQKIAVCVCDLPSDEVSAIAKGKSQFLLSKEEYENGLKQASDLLTELNILEFFVGINEDSAKKESRYIVCDFRDLNNARITRTSEGIALQMLLKARPTSPQIATTDKGKPCFKYKNLPSVFTTYTTSDLLQEKKGTQGTAYLLNPAILGENELIAQILAKEGEGLYSDDYKNDLRELFTKHPFYEILKMNLIPNPQMRAKFLGDLGYFLRTRENANAMLTIFDNGSTGKTRILELFLQYALNGDDAFAKYLPNITQRTKSTSNDRQITTTATAQNDRFKTPTICDLIGKFTGGITPRGINVISDNGDSKITKADIIDLYNGILKNRIKNAYGREERKFADSQNVELHAFYVLFSNTSIYYSATDNTRYYFAQGRRVIDIRNNDSISKHFMGAYTCLKDIHEAMYRDRAKLLEYMLLIAPNESEYIQAGGYYDLKIFNDTTRQTLADLLDCYYDSENPQPNNFAAALSEWLMVNGKINLNRLQECYDSDFPRLSLFCHLLNKVIKETPLNLPQPEGTSEILQKELETGQILQYFGTADELSSIETRKLKTIFTRLLYGKDTPRHAAKFVGIQFAKNFKGYEGENNRISFENYEYTAPKASGGDEVKPTPSWIDTSERETSENRADAVDLYSDYVGEAYEL